MRRSTAVFCLLLALVFSAFAAGGTASGILTNAGSVGVDAGSARSSVMSVNAEKRVWFSVGEGEQLRLLVDGAEQYRGSGPGTVLLSGTVGEERYVEVVAERRASVPESTLIETRRFTFLIDFKAPSAPVFSVKALGPEKYSLSVQAEEGSTVVAAFDREGLSVVRRILKPENELPARRVALVGWAVDAAGNRSEPVSFAYEPFSLRIENPVPGVWSNRQTLAIEAPGATEILWSLDGTDPLSGGKRYEGPVLIDAAGSLHLRCAARAGDGRVERRDLTFTVSDTLPANLSFLAEAERKPVTQNTLFQLPAGYRWDTAIGNEAVPRFDAGRPVVLRPLPQIVRPWALVVASDRGRARFLYELGPLPPSAASAATPAATAMDASVLAVSVSLPAVTAILAESPALAETPAPDPVSAPYEPLLISSRRARVLAWPVNGDRVRVRFTPSGAAVAGSPGLAVSPAWVDSREPFILPIEGGDLDWLVDRGSSTLGPFRIAVPPLDAASGSASIEASEATGRTLSSPVVLSSREASRCALSLKVKEGNARSLLFPIRLGAGERLSLDLCEGEDYDLSILADSERPLFSWRLDRRAPRDPVLNAPEEGTWLSNPVSVGVRGNDRLHAILSWVDPAGKTWEKELTGDETLGISNDGPVSYTLSAWAEDEAGNRSQTVTRHFTLDAVTVYVRPSAALSQADTPDGSRAAPYRDLDSALRAVRTEGRKMLHLSGDFTIQGVLSLPSGVTVEGGFDPDWKKGKVPSVLHFASAGELLLSGAKAVLSSVRLVSQDDRNLPLVRLENGAILSVKSSALNGRGLLFSLDAATLDVTDSAILCAGSAVKAVSSSVSIRNSRAELVAPLLSGATALSSCSAFELDHSSFTTSDLTLVCSAPGSVQAFILRNADFRAKNLSAELKGGRYACAIDASASSVTVDTSSLSATAQDVALATLDAGAASFLRSRLSICAHGVSRAFDARLATARLQSCTLLALGDAPRSEVFAGVAPGPNSVSGNTFIGWDWLWTERYSVDELAGFDRRFSVAGQHNTTAEVPRP